MNTKCVLCKDKSVLYICQRNVYKMSEKVFVMKSFKVLFYRSLSLTVLFDFISLNIIICLMHPERGTINLKS